MKWRFCNVCEVVNFPVSRVRACLDAHAAVRGGARSLGDRGRNSIFPTGISVVNFQQQQVSYSPDA